MSTVPVLIAGAGPTGLVLAIWLRKKGISVRIIDKNSGPGLTSRALAVQARTLEFYRQLGIADGLIEAGITVTELVMWRSSQVVARAQLGAVGEGQSPFPYLLFCSQDVHEEYLCRVLKTLGTEVERDTELIEFQQDDSKVTVRLRGLRGEETLTADYLCGCDGAHSAVRHTLELPFSGGTYSQVFYVADVIAENAAERKGLAISITPKDFCIIMPIRSKDSIRLTGTVPPESENKENITYEDVAETVNRNTGLKITDVRWFSSYHVHHRMAEQFRKGRVFIAGDAAHIHSPAGGQGMNTGIGDAVNLAWKLADVIQGRFTPRLLDSYEPERMAFARVLLRSTDTAFKMLAGRSVVGSLFRAYVFPKIFAGLTRSRAFLKIAFRLISQIRIEYRDSFLSEGAAGELKAGDRLPWLETDNFSVLQSLDWQVHVYGAATKELRTFTSNRGLPLHEFAWSEERGKKGFVKDALYLLRPDGHISLIRTQQDPRALEDYFQKNGAKK